MKIDGIEVQVGQHIVVRGQRGQHGWFERFWRWLFRRPVRNGVYVVTKTEE